MKAQFWSVCVPARTDFTVYAPLKNPVQVQRKHGRCDRYPVRDMGAAEGRLVTRLTDA